MIVDLKKDLDESSDRAYNKIMMNTTKTGSAVKVNGKSFTVERIGSAGTIFLRGPRGASRSLVQNVHNGAWWLCGGPGSALVESFEVVS